MKKQDSEGKMILSENPATLEVNAEIPATPPQDVAGIMENARIAQEEWAAIGPNDRARRLIHVKEHMLDRLDDVARTITLDNGKTLLEALNSEVYPVLDMFNFAAREAPSLLKDEPLKNQVFSIARLESRNVFEPLGVIGIVSPWNFPFAIPMTQIISALVAGNAVVLKPAELTPLVGEMIGRLFSDSNFPDGLVNVVQGSGSEVGEALMAAHPDKMVFTGSVRVGRHLMKRAAELEPMIPITLELGGKDPFIVLDDADIERASSGAVWGAFINAGQVCASVERVYVHTKVADEFIQKVVEKTKKLRIGNGLEHGVDVGPMISENQLSLVEKHVRAAVEKGAEIAAGGRRVRSFSGHFYEPTVLLNVDHGMECMTEETFGPTLPVQIVSDAEEAVELANDSVFGLTGSVWSRDTAKADRIARRIRTGVAVVNNCLLTYGFAQCPWGGVKDSGIGRTHSAHGLYEFTSIKNLTVNKPVLKEDLWWYPYSENKYKAMKSAMKTMFCEGLVCKREGILDVFRNFNLLRKK